VSDKPKGFIRFDLASPAKLLTSAYSPMLGRLPEDRRRLAQSLAAARSESAERFAVMHADWQNAGITASDERVRAVLELHEPFDLGDRVTCTECMSYDSEGDSSSDWPCDTYKAVMG
jgi:hypothetical protein